jgi:hypothetical protein
VPAHIKEGAQHALAPRITSTLSRPTWTFLNCPELVRSEDLAEQNHMFSKIWFCSAANTASLV